jgi:hypothetical protein
MQDGRRKRGEKEEGRRKKQEGRRKKAGSTDPSRAFGMTESLRTGWHDNGTRLRPDSVIPTEGPALLGRSGGIY